MLHRAPLRSALTRHDLAAAKCASIPADAVVKINRISAEMYA